MSSQRPRLGICIPRHYQPTDVLPLARHAEAVGLAEVWFVEDCFYNTAPTLAAVALSGTQHITVGLGVLPAVARTAAITAMEISTLANLAPGRLIAGIGHGVQSWMQQMGVRPRSPLTTLDETISAVRSLLHGERLDYVGQHVSVSDVRLESPPVIVPPVIAGVTGDKSLALAGRVADGVFLDAPTSTAYLDHARECCAAGPHFQFRSLSWWSVADDPWAARMFMAPQLQQAVERRSPMITALPFAEDLVRASEAGGVRALAELPGEYWRSIGAIGSLDDARAHVVALGASGLTSAAFFLPDDPERAGAQIEQMAELIEV